MLAAFRELPIEGLEIERLWTDPSRLVSRATQWAAALQDLDDPERAALDSELTRVLELFEARPAVLTHGDFSPVNVLSDGRSLTGLIDFESVRLADPLFDVAWWEWSVSFSPPAVREAAWPEFLDGARRRERPRAPLPHPLAATAASARAARRRFSKRRASAPPWPTVSTRHSADRCRSCRGDQTPVRR